MNVFVGIVGVVIVIIAVALGCMKSARNMLLDEQLKDVLITKEEWNQKHKGYGGNLFGGLIGIAIFVFAFSFSIFYSPLLIHILILYHIIFNLTINYSSNSS